MNKFISWLSGILVLQLVLVAGLLLNSANSNSNFAASSLLAFDQDQISKVLIASDKDKVTLQKKGESWLLPELENLPADQDKLKRALARLSGLRTNWPIATTDGSHQRFEVSADDYQRHIQLYTGDKPVAELYLGSSPGFRKVHTRVANTAEVYALTLNTFDFPARPHDWLDKSLIAASDIKSIKGPDFLLEKQADVWTLTTESHEATQPDLDQDKAENLSQALSSLKVNDVAESTSETLTEPATSFIVSGSSSWRYQFLKADNKYYVRRTNLADEQAGQSPLFTLNKYVYDNIAGVGLTDLRLVESTEAEGQAQTSDDLEKTDD